MIFSISSEESESETEVEDTNPFPNLLKDSSTEGENGNEDNEFLSQYQDTGILSEEGLQYTREELLKDEIRLAELYSSIDYKLPLVKVYLVQLSFQVLIHYLLMVISRC